MSEWVSEKDEERKADKLGANNHHRNHQFGTTQKAESTTQGIRLGGRRGVEKRGGYGYGAGGGEEGRQSTGEGEVEVEVNLRRRAEKALLVLNDTQTGKK